AALVRDGAVRVAAAGVVVGEAVQLRLQPVGVEVLERGGGGRVQARPARLQERAVGGVADQRVVEAPAPLAPVGGPDAAPAGRVAPGGDVRRLPAEHALERGQVELGAEHRGRLDGAPDVGRKVVQAGDDHLADGRRDEVAAADLEAVLAGCDGAALL